MIKEKDQEKKKLDKKIIIYSILYALNSMINSIIVPFLPFQLYQQKISISLIGLIFSINPIGSLFTKLIFKKVLPVDKKSIILFICTIFKGISISLFAIVAFFENKVAIIIFSFFGQFLLGAGKNKYKVYLIIYNIFFFKQGISGFSLIGYSFLPILYKDFNKKIQFLELMSMIGVLLGPILVGFIFFLINFEVSFFMISILFFVISPFVYKITPRSLRIESPELKFEYSKIIENKKFTFTFLIFVFSNFTIGFLGPTFSIYLLLKFNLNILFIGFIYFLLPLFNILSKSLVKFVIQKTNQQISIFIGSLLIFIGFFMLAIPNLFIVIIVLIMFLGVGSNFVNSPILNELSILLNEIEDINRINIEQKVNIYKKKKKFEVYIF